MLYHVISCYVWLGMFDAKPDCAKDQKCVLPFRPPVVLSGGPALGLDLFESCVQQPPVSAMSSSGWYHMRRVHGGD